MTRNKSDIDGTQLFRVVLSHPIMNLPRVNHYWIEMLKHLFYIAKIAIVAMNSNKFTIVM